MRAKCQDLVDLGLLAYVKVDVNLFDFAVKRVTIDFSSFSSHFQTENQIENEIEKSNSKSASISFISLNKQINTAGDFEGGMERRGCVKGTDAALDPAG